MASKKKNSLQESLLGDPSPDEMYYSAVDLEPQGGQRASFTPLSRLDPYGSSVSSSNQLPLGSSKDELEEEEDEDRRFLKKNEPDFEVGSMTINKAFRGGSLSVQDELNNMSHLDMTQELHSNHDKFDVLRERIELLSGKRALTALYHKLPRLYTFFLSPYGLGVFFLIEGATILTLVKYCERESDSLLTIFIILLLLSVLTFVLLYLNQGFFIPFVPKEIMRRFFKGFAPGTFMVSYSWFSRHDEECSQALAHRVAACFPCCWLDVERLLPGAAVEEACLDAASNCILGFVFISNSYLRSGICKKEIGVLKSKPGRVYAFVHKDVETNISICMRDVEDCEKDLQITRTTAEKDMDEISLSSMQDSSFVYISEEEAPLDVEYVLGKVAHGYRIMQSDGTECVVDAAPLLTSKNPMIRRLAVQVEERRLADAQARLYGARLIEELQQNGHTVVFLDAMQNSSDINVFGGNASPGEHLLYTFIRSGLMSRMFMSCTPAINERWSATAVILSGLMRDAVLLILLFYVFFIFAFLFPNFEFITKSSKFTIVLNAMTQSLFLFSITVVFSSVYGSLRPSIIRLPDIAHLLVVLLRLLLISPQQGFYFHSSGTLQGQSLCGVYWKKPGSVHNGRDVFVKDDFSVFLYFAPAGPSSGRWVISQTLDDMKILARSLPAASWTPVELLQWEVLASSHGRHESSTDADLEYVADSFLKVHKRSSASAFNLVNNGLHRNSFSTLSMLGLFRIVMPNHSPLSTRDFDDAFIDLNIVNLDIVAETITKRKRYHIYWTQRSFDQLPKETQRALANELVSTQCSKRGPEMETVLCQFLSTTLSLERITGVTVGQHSWRSKQLKAKA